MIGILIFAVILVIGYLYYWWDYVRRMKKQNIPANVKLRVSKEFQNLVLSSSCNFKFKLGKKGKVYYKMSCFEPCDDDKEIIIILKKSNGKEEIND